MRSASDKQFLLEIRRLSVGFENDERFLRVVDNVSLGVPPSRVVALVGESGCGKSVTALSVLRLIPQPPGRIEGGHVLLYPPPDISETARSPDHAPTVAPDEAKGNLQPATLSNRQSTIDNRQIDVDAPVHLLSLREPAMRRVRGGRIAMIFQEPMTSLNPVFTIGEQIIEAIELHTPLRNRSARERAVELLDKVGIPHPAQGIDEYPHRLSGGMRQRAMIAMALAGRPELLIADEPTTALDVTIQRQILDLLRAVQAETGMSILLITHDLGVVAEAADDVYVMYAGRIVEHGPVARVLAEPLHPYTRALLACTPRIGQTKGRLEVIPGQVPHPADFPTGCRFHPRCALSLEHARTPGRSALSINQLDAPVLRRCVERYDAEPSGAPPLIQLRPGHFAACWEAE